MSKVNLVVSFLLEHREDLIQELKDEFKLQLDVRKNYKGFKKIMFDKRLYDKMKLSLLDKSQVLDAEERLCFLDEEQVNKVTEEIIERCI